MNQLLAIKVCLRPPIAVAPVLLLQFPRYLHNGALAFSLVCVVLASLPESAILGNNTRKNS